MGFYQGVLEQALQEVSSMNRSSNHHLLKKYDFMNGAHWVYFSSGKDLKNTFYAP